MSEEKVRRTRCHRCEMLVDHIYSLGHGRPKLCPLCALKYCCSCLKETTEEERKLLQVLDKKLVFSDIHTEDCEEVYVGRGIFFCTACHLAERVNAEIAILANRVRKLRFQRQHHICTRCKKINDNRDVDGNVHAKFCSTCERLIADANAQNQIGLRNMEANRDSRGLGFSRIVGVPDREKK